MSEAMAIEVSEPDEADLKRQLLVRAGVATALIVVLLGGLAVHDHLTRNHGAAPPFAPPTPLSQGPAVSGTGPGGGVVAAPEEGSSAAADLPAEPEHTGPPATTPSGKRQVDARDSDAGGSRLILETEAPPARSGHPSTGKHGGASPVGGKGYMVQLGVFASLENAEALRARLEGQGIPARLESRVVVGPFPDQAAARAAQARLREAGQDAGLIVPPRR